MEINKIFGFDYARQAWYDKGVYVRCGHTDAMGCECYGRLHEGEPVVLEVRS